MLKIYLNTQNRAGLIATSFLCVIIAGVLVIYLQNPFWIGFCIGNIIGWGIFGFFNFIIFLVRFVELRTNPDLAKEVEEYRKRFGKLVKNEKKLIKESLVEQ